MKKMNGEWLEFKKCGEEVKEKNSHAGFRFTWNCGKLGAKT